MNNQTKTKENLLSDLNEYKSSSFLEWQEIAKEIKIEFQTLDLFINRKFNICGNHAINEINKFLKRKQKRKLKTEKNKPKTENNKPKTENRKPKKTLYKKW